MKIVKKTKSHRILSLILSLIMIISAVPLSSINVFAESNGIFNYEFIGDGAVEITGYSGDATDVVIPNEIDGYKVTGIGMAAFYFGNGSKIKSVIIPEGIVSIGSQAFENCRALEKVTLPETLELIDHSAFKDCSSLRNITIPKNVNSIGTDAFYGCSVMTEINVDENNEIYYDIDGVLFTSGYSDFMALVYYPDGKHEKSYHIPEGTAMIYNYSFGGCKSLQEIYVPNSVMSVSAEAFMGSMPNLTNIYVDANNENFLDVDGVLFNKDKTWLIKYPEGRKNENYDIPLSVTNMSNEVFRNARNLKNVTIPNGITTIERDAFSGCISLENVEIPNSVFAIRLDAFSNCTSLKSIDLPNALKELEDGAFMWCSSLQKINIPATISSINTGVFDFCSSLREVNIEGTVVTIGNYAFNGCTSLEKINLPYGIKEIGEGAFYECAKLESISIPDSIEYIGEFAFYNDDALVKIYGYVGTAAESYANQNGHEFIALEKKIDESTGISVSENELNVIPDGANVKTEQLSSEENKIIFDISLVKDGSEVQPNGEVMVKFPVPKGMDSSILKVYREEADGIFTDMNAYSANGYMIFTTNHFSKYILTTEELSSAMPGDINGDGKVTAVDARWILQIAAVTREVSEAERKSVDLNKDGKITAVDARWGLQIAASTRVV